MSTTPPRRGELHVSLLDLADARYAVLPESTLRALCRRAGVALRTTPPTPGPLALDLALAPEHLATRLIERRRHAGLSQAELARRAGIRVETLNRIERGHSEPDFATIRKLVEAMNAADAATLASAAAHPSAARQPRGSSR